MCYEHDICEILGRNVHKNENWIEALEITS